MAQRYFTFNNHPIGGSSGTGMVIMDIPELPEPAVMTLRFQFGDKNYNPMDAGVGSSGTWTKLSHPFNNIWDWTNNNTNWSKSFLNAFSDPANQVSIISAGDTSSVENMQQAFAGSSTSDGFISVPNYIKNICLFDTTGVTDMYAMFACNPIIETVPLFDTSNVTNMNAMFYNCFSLNSVPAFDMANVTNADRMFYKCASLHTVPLMDTSSLENATLMFSQAENIVSLPDYDTTSVTNMYGMFNGMPSLTAIPVIDFGNVTNLEIFLGTNNPQLWLQSIERLPDMSTVTTNLVNCTNAFKNVVNAKYGIYEAYLALSAVNPENYADCFKNCGINTEEGRAALAQIPTDWGGTSVQV